MGKARIYELYCSRCDLGALSLTEAFEGCLASDGVYRLLGRNKIGHIKPEKEIVAHDSAFMREEECALLTLPSVSDITTGSHNLNVAPPPRVSSTQMRP
jgi:hypothetical protein